LPYREEVVDDILKNWQKTASGALVAGRRQENAFQAMFAVSGKQAVVHYYNLFKEKAPHLRVAMTFSKDESNKAGTKEQNEALKRAIKDYTTVFNAPSILNAKDPARAYMIDITKRLARKKPYNQDNEEDRLDLVIVSDQLLTGFDSKYVNMIYMDKLLKEGMLIQAMSRTNRTFDLNSKPHGKVRFYRQGDTMKAFVENALRIYTRGGNDTLQEANEDTDQLTNEDLRDDDILAKPQSHQIQELEPAIARLKELAGDDFSQLPKGNDALKEFVQRGLETQNKIQRLVQQGYDLGSEIEELDTFNEPTGKMIRLDISDSSEFGALQSRINDAREKLPEKDRPDLTEIKLAWPCTIMKLLTTMY